MKLKREDKKMKRLGFFKSILARAMSVVAYIVVIVCITAIESESKLPIVCGAASMMWLAIYCGANGQFGGKGDE